MCFLPWHLIHWSPHGVAVLWLNRFQSSPSWCSEFFRRISELHKARDTNYRKARQAYLPRQHLRQQWWKWAIPCISPPLLTRRTRVHSPRCPTRRRWRRRRRRRRRWRSCVCPMSRSTHPTLSHDLRLPVALQRWRRGTCASCPFSSQARTGVGWRCCTPPCCTRWSCRRRGGARCSSGLCWSWRWSSLCGDTSLRRSSACGSCVTKWCSWGVAVTTPLPSHRASWMRVRWRWRSGRCVCLWDRLHWEVRSTRRLSRLQPVVTDTATPTATDATQTRHTKEPFRFSLKNKQTNRLFSFFSYTTFFFVQHNSFLSVFFVHST